MPGLSHMDGLKDLQNATTIASSTVTWTDSIYSWAVASNADMPSIRSLLSTFALSSVSIAQTVLGLRSPVHRLAGSDSSSSAVCSNPQLSCHNTTAVENLCCFNAPGGSLLQTQFWDANPATGPSDSWTIHGLWVGTLAPKHTHNKRSISVLFTNVL